MEQTPNRSSLSVAVDTIFLCLLSLDLGFFTWVLLLQGIGNQSENLAAPIIAIYDIPVAFVSVIVYFFVFRLIQKRLPPSHAWKYVCYTIIGLVALGILAFIIIGTRGISG
jgi:membrane protease YdiL (CAAX protease family)